MHMCTHGRVPLPHELMKKHHGPLPLVIKSYFLAIRLSFLLCLLSSLPTSEQQHPSVTHCPLSWMDSQHSSPTPIPFQLMLGSPGGRSFLSRICSRLTLSFVFQDVIRAMNVNPKISFPPEVDFCLLTDFIQEICCIAFAMQSLEPPLDIAFGADGEIFNDCK
jgi:hypothetical protein